MFYIVTGVCPLKKPMVAQLKSMSVSIYVILKGESFVFEAVQSKG